MSRQQDLPQAGLPQGSPLSPILFLLFNADLVQQRLSANGGAMAFVDDYTAWVTGPSEDANRTGIQDIVDRAIEWATRSGATFESEKTKIIHFTRNRYCSASAPVTVQGQTIGPQVSIKILGVVMDTKLRYHFVFFVKVSHQQCRILNEVRLIIPICF